MKIRTLQPEFVENFSEQLEEGKLYISEAFSSAGHKCCCGCGEEVITPLNPAQWMIRKDGGLVSLQPSVGNWKFACRSHYWIRKNRVIDAPPLSERVIERVKKRDRRDKDILIQKINKASTAVGSPTQMDRVALRTPLDRKWDTPVIDWLKKWWHGE